MIEVTHGNLLNADAGALVNTVNCVGIMGKGLALQFKQAFPENTLYYERACAKHEVVPGRIFVYDIGTFAKPRYIMNFPTKRHWKGKSKIEDIASGLRSLIAEIERLEIESIAVPLLGCGLGGLDWSTVKPMIEEAFASVPDVRVLVYEPAGHQNTNAERSCRL